MSSSSSTRRIRPRPSIRSILRGRYETVKTVPDVRMTALRLRDRSRMGAFVLCAPTATHAAQDWREVSAPRWIERKLIEVDGVVVAADAQHLEDLTHLVGHFELR